jgi:hypothetical protein
MWSNASAFRTWPRVARILAGDRAAGAGAERVGFVDDQQRAGFMGEAKEGIVEARVGQDDADVGQGRLGPDPCRVGGGQHGGDAAGCLSGDGSHGGGRRMPAHRAGVSEAEVDVAMPVHVDDGGALGRFGLELAGPRTAAGEGGSLASGHLGDAVSAGCGAGFPVIGVGHGRMVGLAGRSGSCW